jgi:hypothetical protein
MSKDTQTDFSENTNSANSLNSLAMVTKNPAYIFPFVSWEISERIFSFVSGAKKIITGNTLYSMCFESISAQENRDFTKREDAFQNRLDSLSLLQKNEIKPFYVSKHKPGAVFECVIESTLCTVITKIDGNFISEEEADVARNKLERNTGDRRTFNHFPEAEGYSLRATPLGILDNRRFIGLSETDENGFCKKELMPLGKEGFVERLQYESEEPQRKQHRDNVFNIVGILSKLPVELAFPIIKFYNDINPDVAIPNKALRAAVDMQFGKYAATSTIANQR